MTNKAERTKHFKTKIVASVALFMSATMIVPIPASAASFSFFIPTHLNNGHEATPQYRNVTSQYNQWQVKLISSGEGNGALSDFWLEKNNGTNVAPYRRVKCGSGWYGQEAYASANHLIVYLTAEDNKDKASGYTVSGKWKQQS